MSDTPEQFSDLPEETRKAIAEIGEARANGEITRRQAMTLLGSSGLAALGLGAGASQYIGSAEAATGNAGPIGTQTERPDAYLDVADANTVTAEQIDNTAKVVYGHPYDTTDTYISRKVSNFANAGAAAQDIHDNVFGSLGGEILLPPGSLNGDISITKDDTKISGRGSKVTRLFGNVTFTDVELPALKHLQVQGESIVFDSSASGSTSHAWIEDVISIGSSGIGLKIDSLLASHLIGVRIRNPTNECLNLRQTNAINIIGGVYDGGSEGIRVDRSSNSPSDRSATSVRMFGGLVILNEINGINLRGVQNAQFYGTRWERNNTSGGGGNDIVLQADSSGNPCLSCSIDNADFVSGGSTYVSNHAVNCDVGAEHTTIKNSRIEGVNSAYPTAIRARGAFTKIDDNDYVNVTERVNEGDKTIWGKVSTNSGNPSTTGLWNGFAQEAAQYGVTVIDDSASSPLPRYVAQRTGSGGYEWREVATNAP